MICHGSTLHYGRLTGTNCERDMNATKHYIYTQQKLGKKTNSKCIPTPPQYSTIYFSSQIAMTQNPMVDQTTTQKSYINTTRNILTASKIKLAMMNTKAYNIVYNLTPEDVAETYEEKKEDHFQFGTMAHKLLEMFNEKNLTLQEIVDKFLEEYDITNRYLKADYIEMIIQQKCES